MWRQKRLRQYDEQTLQAQVEGVQLTRMRAPARAAIKALAPEFASANSVEKVEQLLKKHKAFAAVIETWVPRPVEVQNEGSWGPAIADHLKKLEVGEFFEGPAEVLNYIDPIKLEMQEDRMARLDERILAIVKRLAQVKATKALFGPGNTETKTMRMEAGRPKLTIDNEPAQPSDASNMIWWKPGNFDYRSGNKDILKELEDKETAGAVFTTVGKTLIK
jgi:hypothetical protein